VVPRLDSAAAAAAAAAAADPTVGPAWEEFGASAGSVAARPAAGHWSAASRAAFVGAGQGAEYWWWVRRGRNSASLDPAGSLDPAWTEPGAGSRPAPAAAAAGEVEEPRFSLMLEA